jgi:hypothetical protein
MLVIIPFVTVIVYKSTVVKVPLGADIKLVTLILVVGETPILWSLGSSNCISTKLASD